MVAPSLDYAELARHVAPLVIQHLAGALAKPATYSSRKGHGAPGYSAREWRALAKRIGTKRGRWWTVTAEQLAAHEAPQPAPAERWSPEQAARDLGLRPQR
jgi:hypothetical protein